MRLSRKNTVLFFLLGAAVAIGTIVHGAELSPGMSGDDVLSLQRDLCYLDYLAEEPTGYYGSATEEAVAAFQRDNGLKPDGTMDDLTFNLIAQRVREESARLAARRDESTGLIPWNEVNPIFPPGTTARVWDVATGIDFFVWRLGGTFHADVEPLTRKDTGALLRACGGSWNHARRAALVLLNGRLIAASMYAYPHGSERILDNGFQGQFCLHFLGSRVHQTGRVDPDHQAMIMLAAKACPEWRVSEPSPDSTLIPVGEDEKKDTNTGPFTSGP